MNRSFWLPILAVILLVSPIESMANSQKLPPGTDAAEASESSLAKAGPRTSPFDPPEATDRNFVTDDAPKLDTGCLFRASGPIVFDIEITRHVGEIPR